MNMLLVMRVLDLSAEEMQVMLFDKYENVLQQYQFKRHRYPDGPYIDLIKRAYSPKYDVIRHAHYSGKKVRLVSPCSLYWCCF